MKTLIASGPLRSHVDPTAQAARILQRGGHEVRYVAPACMASYAKRAYGLEITRAGIDWTQRGAIGPLLADAYTRGGNSAFMAALQNIAADGIAPMRDDVRHVCEYWHPDVIVRDSSDVGSLLAARALGIPSVALDVGVSEHTAEIGPVVRTLRERHDDRPSAEPLLTPAPPGLLLEGPQVRPFQHEDPMRDGEALPGWLAEQSPDLPLVYVSLGSLLTRTPGLATYTARILQRIARGLARLPVSVVMSTGPAEHDRLCAALSDLPRLLLLGHAPQTLLMRTADLFVTHAGFGSLREAISSGVPMLAVGLTTDQPGNASRLSHLGLGVSLPPYAEQAEFTAAAELILTDRAKRATVRTWQLRMLAQEPLTKVLPAVLDEATRAARA